MFSNIPGGIPGDPRQQLGQDGLPPTAGDVMAQRIMAAEYQQSQMHGYNPVWTGTAFARLVTWAIDKLARW